MKNIFTALTQDTDNMAETYRIRRLMALAVSAVVLGFLILLLPWGWVPTPNIPTPTTVDCEYDFDQAGQLWHTAGCDPNDLP